MSYLFHISMIVGMFCPLILSCLGIIALIMWAERRRQKKLKEKP